VVSNNLATGVVVLQVVFPYTNIAATEGIKEDVNADYDNTRVQLDFIHHRKAMTSLVRDAKAINPEMPFAARDFAGKWQFVLDNLTCGTMNVAVLDANGNALPGFQTVPIPVANERRNKGKFITDFGGAIQAEYPELEEGFFSLREPACIVDIPVCASDPGYPYQNYESANAVCPQTAAGTNVTLTFTPTLQATTGTYEVPRDSITCNSMLVVHAAITGATTIAALVAQLNANLAAMGIWTAAGSNITLSSTNCTLVSIPWSV
jgi:hypothetical protein